MKTKRIILIASAILLTVNLISLSAAFYTRQDQYVYISVISGLLLSPFLIIYIFQRAIATKHREEELLDIIKNKDLLFSIISQDLKVPANNMSSLTSMLISEDKLQREDHTKITLMLNSSAQNHSQMVNNLLDWSKIQMKNPIARKLRVDLSMIVKNNIKIYNERCAAKNIHIISYIKEKTIIGTDPDMLDTILRNLINNAIKFSKAGGRITINNKLTNQYIWIHIEDNGIGMDKKTKDNLFKSHNHVSMQGTSNEVGSGIGLILCHELIKKLKGEIYVTSELGKGSKFTCVLPLGINHRIIRKELKKRFITHLFKP
jgi:signal transduction histidine kinase